MMKAFYEKKENEGKIPVYIELNRCPAQIGMWYSHRYKKTNFITRYIAAMLDGGDYDQINEERLNRIEEELRQKPENGTEKYVLLLDGFNEVSRNQTENESGKTGQSIRETLRREISVLSSYGNITLVLTSRRVDKSYLPGGMEVLYLKGLNMADIRNYLQDVNYSEIEINEIEMSPKLVSCLQIPLFLCMFACRNQNKKIRPLTRGEILYNFFHKESPFYGEQKNIRSSFSRDYSEQVLISFIMDFILPYIGNMMESSGEFHVYRSDILEGIESFLQDDEVPFWDPGIEVFREYEKEGLLADVLEKVKQIPAKQIMDCMVGTLGIINYDGRGGYSFVHHHVRDYFSSIYEIQWLRCAVALRQKEQKSSKEPSEQVVNALGSIWYEVWGETRQIFVGEILSEHRNAPYVDSKGKWCSPDTLFPEQRLLGAVMDIFRNTKEYPGRCICNIVEILKKVRKNLSGENFSGLDLRECRFYETVCSIGEGENQLAASFQDAILSNDTFYYEGHLGGYDDFEIVGDRVYTLGADERVLIWDAESCQSVASFEVGNTFYSDTHIEDRQIVVEKGGGFLIKHYEYVYTEDGPELEGAEIRSYNVETREYVKMKQPDGPAGIWDMGYSANGRFVVSIWEDNYVCIYDRRDGRIQYSFRVETEGDVRHIAMPEDEIIILHIQDGSAETIESEYDRIYTSRWSFVKVCLKNRKKTHIFSYQTAYSLNNEYGRPVFSFSGNGWNALIYEEQKIKTVNLKSGTKSVIQEIPDGMFPESVGFLNGISEYVAIFYGDSYAVWNLAEDTHTIYTGKILEEARKIIMGMYHIYVLNSAVELMEWDIEDEEKVRKVFPQVELTILGITGNEELNELCIQYSNNSILLVDEKSGKLKTSIYYPEYSMEMEYCDYLLRRHLLFMVFGSEESEEIVVYSLENGRSTKIHVNFKSRLRFHGAIAYDNDIYIAFDKKAVEVDLETLEMRDIWNAREGEELLSIKESNGRVGILVREKQLRNIPYYNVYCKKEQGKYAYAGKKHSVLLKEEQAQKMIPFSSPEFIGYCSDTGLPLFTQRGIFLEWDSEISDVYRKAGMKPWELTTIFYYVHDYAKAISIQKGEQRYLEICDITDEEIVIVQDYSQILIYKMDHDNIVLETDLSIIGREDDSILDVCLDAGDIVHCRLEDDTLVSVDRTGRVIREYNWIPGLIIAGCDFRGAVADQGVKDILRSHGGRV